MFRTDNEKTFSALIPNKENKLINIASLVPNPFRLIGIIEIKVPIGNIAKK